MGNQLAQDHDQHAMPPGSLGSATSPPGYSSIGDPTSPQFGFMIGQSLPTHGYRVLKSSLYPHHLHPLVDFIIYDPEANAGQLMSEYIFEAIFREMMTR